MKRTSLTNTLLLSVILLCSHTGYTQELNSEIQSRWYKNSIVYNLDVQTFKDSDGDGKGDFQGLIQKLDYLKSLGVDVLWLSPFQPSPRKDDGYDVADYYGIDSACGTPGDFSQFMDECSKRGIRVMMDIVLNHTSDQHPWFRQARANAASPYHDWYAWSAKKPSNFNKGMAFPGVQDAIWTYDSVAAAYYFHRFYRFQPDLNLSNPLLQKEAERILSYWLRQGMSGFRLDAVPFMIEIAQPGNDKPPQQYELISRLQRFVQWRKADAILLGEANVPPTDNTKYFGEKGDGLQMMFNFYANQYLFYALASGNTSLLATALQDTRPANDISQWAYFLRNHDEIDLGRLSNKQRQEVYNAFGPDTSMQLYDRGIRRRLAPMLNNNRARLEMAYSLLLALPGTPVIRYGDEIGMGDDLRLQERLSVRTPMQWNAKANAGFTTADTPFRPVITDGTYDYKKLNIEQQELRDNSMLNWFRKMIALRKAHPEIGAGNWQIVPSTSSNTLTLLFKDANRQLMVIHNFSSKSQRLTIKADSGQMLQGLLHEKTAIPANNGTWTISLNGYGYQWMEIK